MKSKDIEAYVTKWMNSYEPDTFIPNEHGTYIYRSGASGINIVCFFEDLLKDFIDDSDQQNDKLVEEKKELSALLSSTIDANTHFQNKELTINQQLQSELTQAKERIESLESKCKGLEEKQWISVGERLPDVEGTYLGFINTTQDNWIETIYYYEKQWTLGLFRKSEFVTHWMPLPNKPQSIHKPSF